MPFESAMHDDTVPLAGSLLTVDQELEGEFEARLVESSTLAFRVAYSVLRQRQDAEDVAQDAFVKAYRRFSQLRDRDRFRAWLVRMTWRLALDRRRSDRRRVEREQTGGPGSVGGEQAARVAEGFTPPALEAIAAGERRGQLWAAIDALPEKLRMVVVLANIEEQDIGAVAQLLGLPPGTVKSRLFLARQSLKERLQWTR